MQSIGLKAIHNATLPRVTIADEAYDSESCTDPAQGTKRASRRARSDDGGRGTALLSLS